MVFLYHITESITKIHNNVSFQRDSSCSDTDQSCTDYSKNCGTCNTEIKRNLPVIKQRTYHRFQLKCKGKPTTKLISGYQGAMNI